MARKKRNKNHVGQRAARPLDWNDLLRMKEYCLEHKRWRDLLLLVIPGSTAFRHSDFTRLTWQDVMSPEIVWVEKKTGNRRRVNLGDEPLRLISMAYNAIMFQTPPSRRPTMMGRIIFSNASGAPLSRAGVKSILESLADEVGGIPKPISSHSLRKAWALRMYTLMGKNFNALLAVSAWLGHRNPPTTVRYLGFDQENRAQYANALWANEQTISLPGILAPSV